MAGADDYTAAIIETIDGIWDWGQDARNSNNPGLMEKRSTQAEIRDRYRNDPQFRQTFLSKRDVKSKHGQNTILRELGGR